ncbi:MAG TPA: AAA family ATPase [Phycisphaerae bacterium]|nr:AAA family ATPase [Phycisphaerae bacterium]
MIESIEIADIATYGPQPQSLGELRKINYVFGANGSGKTTISRIIADPAFGPKCQCKMRTGSQTEAVVLNRDFVQRNFGELRGVFTLGEEQKDTLERIDEAKRQLDKDLATLAANKKTLSGEDGTCGKKGELKTLEKDFQEKCWAVKSKYDSRFTEVFRGVRGSAMSFKDRILKEAETNTAELQDLSNLEMRAKSVYGGEPKKVGTVATLDAGSLLSYESHPVLKKAVIGTADAAVAEVITQLSNSDWVRQGLEFASTFPGVCPFCQQRISEGIISSLNSYFDAAFEEDTKEIHKLLTTYGSHSADLAKPLRIITSSANPFLNRDSIEVQKDILQQRLEANLRQLKLKKEKPSQPIGLSPLRDVISKINALVADANRKTTEHNRMLDNLALEQQKLANEVWRFVLEELDVDLSHFLKNRSSLDKAISGLSDSIDKVEARIRERNAEIQSLERQSTSVRPTVDAINALLKKFGFDGFNLSLTDDERYYRLVRPNGEIATETLSEGEKTFVVFLYFYYLLRGSTAQSGMTTDRVAVFDDPVSSLDSDVLFIVSSLIREVCANVRAGLGHVKQVFVLTHNVYFHKEVTYDSARQPDSVRSDESFWIVRKRERFSNIKRQNHNPIKTSYELLWSEIRVPDNTTTGIENTLRRILEHYFTILGSVKNDEICNKFDGQDKLLCNSLFSWVNAGSHSVFDDAHMSPGDTSPENYLRVFKSIFHKMGHIAHYQMMMGETDDAAEETEAPARDTSAAVPAPLGNRTERR